MGIVSGDCIGVCVAEVVVFGDCEAMLLAPSDAPDDVEAPDDEADDDDDDDAEEEWAPEVPAELEAMSSLPPSGR